MHPKQPQSQHLTEVDDNPTISNTVDLTTMGFPFVGVGGDLKVDLIGNGSTPGGTTTLQNVPSGTLLPIVVSRIYSTGTNATGIKILR